MLMSREGNRGPYLKVSNCQGQPPLVKVDKVSHHQDLLQEAFPGLCQNAHVKKYNFIVVQGVHYTEKDAFVVSIADKVPQ